MWHRLSWLWSCALMGAALAACDAGDAEGCGGPTSDFPFCSPDEAPDDLTGGEPPTGGSNGGGNGGAEGGSDAGASGGASPDAGVSCSFEPLCPEPFAGDATTPFGPLHFEQLSLVYHGGQAPSTALMFLGHYESGDEARLTIVLPGAGGTEQAPAAPVGIYHTGQPGEGSAGLGDCGEEESLPVTVELTEHSFSLDEPGHIAGVVRLVQMGWMIELPFDTENSCIAAPPLP